MSDYIPEGIQFLILKLLPVKSLLRFRCVCKWWKQFIDSPTFTQDHLALQKPSFLVERGERELLVLDPITLPLVDTLRGGPIEDETWRFSLFGTLHGVVCLYDHGSNILLWNPSICKFSSIPLPEDLDFEWVFNDACHTCFGFWIDPSTKEFKIVIFCFDFDEGEDDESVIMFGIVYSSIRQDWSVIPDGEEELYWMPWINGPSLVIGGVAHLGGECEFTMHEQETKSIMSFDFMQESFEFIEMPNLKYPTLYSPRLFHWQGTLSFMNWDQDSPHRCDIFSRREDSWVNMFSFNLVSSICKVFWVLGEREERFRALAATVHQMVVYDTGVGFIPLRGGGFRDGFRDCHATYDFVESLLFP